MSTRLRIGAANRSASAAVHGHRQVSQGVHTTVLQGIKYPGSHAGTSTEDATWRRHIDDAVLRFPLPSEKWRTLTMPSGDVYYWNRVSDQTTWEHPLAGVADDLVEAASDCWNAGKAGSSNRTGAGSATQARKSRMVSWSQRWRDCACKELATWRSVKGEDGEPTYFYKVTNGDISSDSIAGAPTTWEDPRASLELQLRFKDETLASVLGLSITDVPSSNQPVDTRPPVNEIGVTHLTGGAVDHRTSRPMAGSAKSRASDSRSRASDKTNAPRAHVPTQRRMRSDDGQWFFVEELPADHSCGFHGLGINRKDAATLLHKHRNDAEVQAFVVADFFSLTLTGDRKTMPADIRNEERLWKALESYYAAQQGLDQKRREAREFLAEDGGAEVADAVVEAAGGTVEGGLQKLFTELKDAIQSALSGGKEKLLMMQRLSRCKAQLSALQTAATDGDEAEKALRKQCKAKADAYVSWVGSDMSFWLSFVRGCGDRDRGGGLLDALAKVCGFTVRIWVEPQQRGEHDLELVHVAPFGGKKIDLWFQGNRGHFDRLVPCTDVDDFILDKGCR